MSSGAVGADASNGVLSPATFRADGKNVTITSITSQSVAGEGAGGGSYRVKAGFSPYVSLTGFTLDFIILDGTVGTSLDVDTATVNADTGVLTWDVSQKPWAPGDLLMLRLRLTTLNAQPPSPRPNWARMGRCVRPLPARHPDARIRACHWAGRPQ